jgi:hypothetical protein
MAKKPKEPKPEIDREREIERIARMNPAELCEADLATLVKIKRARTALAEIEVEMDELKERRKMRKEALEEALNDADTHTQCRQLALNLVPA